MRKEESTNTHMGIQPVGHELKFSIGRNEGDGAIVLKARQTNTLVKLDVLQLYWFTLAAWKKKTSFILRLLMKFRLTIFSAFTETQSQEYVILQMLKHNLGERHWKFYR